MEWFIAAFGALLGTVVGFFLSLWLIKKEGREKKKSLLKAYYLEFSMIKSSLDSFLIHLDDEFKQPKRGSYSGALDYEFDYIDSFAQQLIVQGHVPNEKQRLFVTRLKRTIAGLMDKDKKRREAILRQKYAKFFIPTDQTAYLIITCVELIYYLNDFILKKEKFDLDSKTNVSISGQAIVAYKAVGLEFDKDTWARIESFN
jgi:hypothetical protein